MSQWGYYQQARRCNEACYRPNDVSRWCITVRQLLDQDRQLDSSVEETCELCKSCQNTYTDTLDYARLAVPKQINKLTIFRWPCQPGWTLTEARKRHSR